jgi:hypothetical protein
MIAISICQGLLLYWKGSFTNYLVCVRGVRVGQGRSFESVKLDVYTLVGQIEFFQIHEDFGRIWDMI